MKSAKLCRKKIIAPRIDLTRISQAFGCRSISESGRREIQGCEIEASAQEQSRKQLEQLHEPDRICPKYRVKFEQLSRSSPILKLCAPQPMLRGVARHYKKTGWAQKIARSQAFEVGPLYQLRFTACSFDVMWQIATLVLIGVNCLWSRGGSPVAPFEGVSSLLGDASHGELRMSVDADLNDATLLPEAEPIFQAGRLAQPDGSLVSRREI